jgi:hypothetical protein
MSCSRRGTKDRRSGSRPAYADRPRPGSAYAGFLVIVIRQRSAPSDASRTHPNRMRTKVGNLLRQESPGQRAWASPAAFVGKQARSFIIQTTRTPSKTFHMQFEESNKFSTRLSTADRSGGLRVRTRAVSSALCQMAGGVGSLRSRSMEQKESPAGALRVMAGLAMRDADRLATGRGLDTRPRCGTIRQTS